MNNQQEVSDSIPSKEEISKRGKGDGIASIIFGVASLFVPGFLTEFVAFVGALLGVRAYRKGSKKLGISGAVVSIIVYLLAVFLIG